MLLTKSIKGKNLDPQEQSPGVLYQKFQKNTRSDIKIQKYSSIQVFKYAIFKYSSILVFKYTSIQVY